MIDIKKSVPDVYYNESRDFQLIGRILEALSNYNKMGVDCMENITDPNNIDERLVSLLAKTVGFESKHEYNVHNLKVVCGCFNDILKLKGTKMGVDKAIAALLNSQGSDQNFESMSTYSRRHFDVYIPSQTKDVILLKDLFEYILPVGWDYSVITGFAGSDTKYVTPIHASSSYTDTPKPSRELNDIAKLSGGESGEETRPTSLNVIYDDIDKESGD